VRPYPVLYLFLTLLISGCQLLEGPRQDRADLRVPVIQGTDTTGLDPLIASRAMVVSGHPEASRVGLEVLQAGGNAVDAAVATAFALAVAAPYAGNVGGGGFIVIRFPDGTATTIDFREMAPLAATRDMFIDEDGEPKRGLSTTGHLASGVPASPAGLLLSLERYGTLDRSAVLDPSIEIAENGFALTTIQARRFNSYRTAFSEFESTRRYFVKPDGSDFGPHETFVQRDLAGVLRRIREHGHDGFYRGETADLIVAEMERGGGIITHDDLARYEAVERPALIGSYRGYSVVTMPPPSGGGITLLQLLNAMEPVDFGSYGFQSTRAVHRAAEAMRRAFADRAVWGGDPDHVLVPTEGLVSKAYMRSRMSTFNPNRATLSSRVRAGQPPGAPPPDEDPRALEEGTETIHLSVIDESGMAVSLTTTVNSWYGSKVVVDGAGFFLNNLMDDFTTAPGIPNVWGEVTGERNTIAPGKRMLSSMTPTIVVDPHGRPHLVVGTPGGTTIPTTVFQIITGIIDFGLPLQPLIEAPRFHHQWTPDVLHYERGFSTAAADSLATMGWSTSARSGTSGAVAAIQIIYDDDTGERHLIGAFDPRRDVTPAGE
jgi:gamma-glutamyltranspeptidase / glutathione hydrolase